MTPTSHLQNISASPTVWSWARACAVGRAVAADLFDPDTAMITTHLATTWVAVHLYAARGRADHWAPWMADPITATPAVVAALADIDHDDTDTVLDQYASLTHLCASRRRDIADLLATDDVSALVATHCTRIPAPSRPRRGPDQAPAMTASMGVARAANDAVNARLVAADHRSATSHSLVDTGESPAPVDQPPTTPDGKKRTP
ncbi:hypothetical protein [Gordonia sp. N1V]|uniref:hypothetical protein n=1 Tax=Gordonia sp. N1V TaxID=3034163 RepID=UPI0023E34774|nr:hypothetical protein [Gordonia sp. N1V]MDF3285027.1 hypothetical protein [Gordonia sp. N1V]